MSAFQFPVSKSVGRASSLSRQKLKQPRKASFRDKGEAEELDEILRLYQVQADVLWNQLFSGTEEQIPNSKNDAIIAVVLITKRGVMNPMKGGRYENVGDLPFTRECNVRVVEEHEEHTQHFANDDHIHLHAKRDRAQTLENDLKQLIEYVKP